MTDFEKTKEFNDLLKKHQAYAKKNNFCLNPNSDIIKSLILAIIKKRLSLKRLARQKCKLM